MAVRASLPVDCSIPVMVVLQCHGALERGSWGGADGASKHAPGGGCWRRRRQWPPASHQCQAAGPGGPLNRSKAASATNSCRKRRPRGRKPGCVVSHKAVSRNKIPLSLVTPASEHLAQCGWSCRRYCWRRSCARKVGLGGAVRTVTASCGPLNRTTAPGKGCSGVWVRRRELGLWAAGADQRRGAGAGGGPLSPAALEPSAGA
jgi:hypothetical protein